LPLDQSSGLFTKAMFMDFFKNKQLDPDAITYEVWLQSQGLSSENEATSVSLLRYLHRFERNFFCLFAFSEVFNLLLGSGI
jgi:hypothetical protein